MIGQYLNSVRFTSHNHLHRLIRSLVVLAFLLYLLAESIAPLCTPPPTWKLPCIQRQTKCLPLYTAYFCVLRRPPWKGSFITRTTNNASGRRVWISRTSRQPSSTSTAISFKTTRTVQYSKNKLKHLNCKLSSTRFLTCQIPLGWSTGKMAQTWTSGLKWRPRNYTKKPDGNETRNTRISRTPFEFSLELEVGEYVIGALLEVGHFHSQEDKGLRIISFKTSNNREITVM